MACGRLIRHLTTSKPHSYVHGQELALHLSVTLTVMAQTSAARYLHVHAEADGSGSVPCRCSVVDLSRMEVTIYLSTSYLYLLVALPQVLYVTYIPVSL